MSLTQPARDLAPWVRERLGSSESLCGSDRVETTVSAFSAETSFDQWHGA